MKSKKLKKITKSDKILFVCKGNINRSVFAEFYINHKYNMNANSCGIIKKRNRMCSHQLLKISNDKFKIDISDHKSRYIGDLDLKCYDKIIVFDSLILNYFKKNKQNIFDKIFVLSSKSIEDPYNKNFKTFEVVFKTISKRIDDIFSNNNINQ